MTDLDDISNCPLAPACATCGTTEDLDIGTVDSEVGVFCMTLCRSCAHRGTLGVPLAGATRRALEHCAHLGIDADRMAELMEDERRG